MRVARIILFVRPGFVFIQPTFQLRADHLLERGQHLLVCS